MQEHKQVVEQGRAIAIIAAVAIVVLLGLAVLAVVVFANFDLAGLFGASGALPADPPSALPGGLPTQAPTPIMPDIHAPPERWLSGLG